MKELLPIIPTTYQILTNLDCNLRCKYCFEYKKNRGKNDIKYIKQYIDWCIQNTLKYMKANQTNRKCVFDFIGGESLLHPDMLTECIEHVFLRFHENEIPDSPIFSISTNGTLFDDPKVQRLFEKYGRYFAVGFSIDGTKDIHDRNRVDIHGNGTYDRAVKGWKWIQQHVCKHRLSVKATYNHDTIEQYAEGVINLIQLGFTEISANTVFEEDWLLSEVPMIKKQLYQIVDYLFDHDLEKKVGIFKITSLGSDELFNDDMLPFMMKSGNHCGSCTHMRCIGMDNRVYGCHRFATINNPKYQIGHMENSEMILTNQEFVDTICKQYTTWPEDCRKCQVGQTCGSCSAAPYDDECPDPARYFGRKGQCGFTMAIAAARCYYIYRLQQKNNS